MAQNVPKVPDILRDPDFRGLNPQEKVKVLNTVDADFRGLPDTEKLRVITAVDPTLQQVEAAADIAEQFTKLGQLQAPAQPPTKQPTPAKERGVFSPLDMFFGAGTIGESFKETYGQVTPRTPEEFKSGDYLRGRTLLSTAPIARSFNEAYGQAGTPTAGLVEGLSQAVSGLFTPESLALMYGAGLPGRLLAGTRYATPIQKGISGAFTVDMGIGSAQNLRDIQSAIVAGDPTKAYNAAGNLAVNLGFTTAAGVHTLSPGPKSAAAQRFLLDQEFLKAVEEGNAEKAAAAFVRVQELPPPPSKISPTVEKLSEALRAEPPKPAKLAEPAVELPAKTPIVPEAARQASLSKEAAREQKLVRVLAEERGVPPEQVAAERERAKFEQDTALGQAPPAVSEPVETAVIKKQDLSRALFRVQKAGEPGDYTRRVSELRDALKAEVRGKSSAERMALADQLEKEAAFYRNRAGSVRAASEINESQAQEMRFKVSEVTEEYKLYERKNEAGEVIGEDITKIRRPVLPASERTAMHLLLGDAMKEVKGISETRASLKGQPEKLAELEAWAEQELRPNIERNLSTFRQLASEAGVETTDVYAREIEALKDLVDQYEAATGKRFVYGGKGSPVALPTGEILPPGLIPEPSEKLSRALYREAPSTPTGGAVVERDSKLAQLARKSDKTPAEWAEYERLKQAAGVEKPLLTAPEGRGTAKYRRVPKPAAVDRRIQELTRAAEVREQAAQAIRKQAAARLAEAPREAKAGPVTHPPIPKEPLKVETAKPIGEELGGLREDYKTAIQELAGIPSKIQRLEKALHPLREAVGDAKRAFELARQAAERSDSVATRKALFAARVELGKARGRMHATESEIGKLQERTKKLEELKQLYVQEAARLKGEQVRGVPVPETPVSLSEADVRAHARYGKLYSELSGLQKAAIDRSYLPQEKRKFEPEERKPSAGTHLVDELLSRNVLSAKKATALSLARQEVNADGEAIIERTARERWPDDTGKVRGYARGLRVYLSETNKGNPNALAKALEAVKRDPEAGFVGDRNMELTSQEKAAVDRDRNRLQRVFMSKLATLVEQKMKNWVNVSEARGVMGIKAGQDMPTEAKVLNVESLLQNREFVSKKEVLEHIERTVPRVEVVEYSDRTVGLTANHELLAMTKEHSTLLEQLKARLRQTGLADTAAARQISFFAEEVLSRIETEREAPTLGVSGAISSLYRSDATFRTMIERFGELDRDILEVESQHSDPRSPQYTLPGGSNHQERVYKEPGVKEGFVSENHYPEAGPGYLWHDVVKDRTTTAGEKVIFIEEVQSDRAMALDESRAQLTRTHPYYDDATLELSRPEIRQRVAERSFPFEKNWHELAVKRILLEAVARGKEGIAWTTGRQQNERYDVSREVDRLSYTDLGDGRISLRGRLSQKERGMFQEGAFGDEGLVNKIWQRDELVRKLETVNGPYGREIAEKILAGEGRKSGIDVETDAEGYMKIQPEQVGVPHPVTFIDLPKPLTIGGSEHIALYDQMIPQWLRRFSKQFGGVVETREISVLGVPSEYVKSTETVHFFKIPEAMRMRIAREGVPMFGNYLPRQGAPSMYALGFLSPEAWREHFPIFGRLAERIPSVRRRMRANEALRDEGIEIEDRLPDLGVVARYLGSPSQYAQKGILGKLGSFSKLPPEMQKKVLEFFEVTAELTESELAAASQLRRIFGDIHSRTRGREWEDVVVKLLDDPNVSPDRFPSEQVSKLLEASYGKPRLDRVNDIWYNYTKARELFDMQRDLAIRARRNADKIAGFDDKMAIERTPDDWGIQAGYYMHAFPGSFKVMRQVSVGQGQFDWTPIEGIGWKAETKTDALLKAHAYREAHPDVPVRIERETTRFSQAGATPRKKMRDVNKKLRQLDKLEAGTPQFEELLGDALRESGAAAFGPQRVASRRFTGSAMHREKNLSGWATDFDTFKQGILSFQRYITLTQGRPKLLKMRNDIASFYGEAPVLKPSDIKAQGEWLLVGKMDKTIQAVEGYPTAWQRFARSHFRGEVYDRVERVIMTGEAVAKLGGNLMSGLLNLTQTGNTFAVLGPKYTALGIAGFFSNFKTKKYRDLINKLGIRAQSTKIDTEGFREYFTEYTPRSLREVPSATVKGLYDLAMLSFQTPEKFNREVAAIAGYEKAKAEGLSEAQAIRAAAQLVRRTQFSFERWDRPAVLQSLPAPLAQFKTFTFKQIEFMTGLKGAELARYLAVAVGIYGVSGLPGVNLLDEIVESVTGRSFLGKMKLSPNPVVQAVTRGVVPFAAGADISAGAGFADLFGMRQFEFDQLGGPFASDVSRGVKAFMTGTPGSRSREWAFREWLAGLSPHVRRAMSVEGDNLIDIRSGAVIMTDLTPAERTMMAIGVTPIRVKTERDFHRELTRRKQSFSDEKGGLVDYIATRMLALGDGDTAPEAADKMNADIDHAIEQLREKGMAKDLRKALIRRIKELQTERSLKDVMRQPVPLRGEAFEEYERMNPPPPE